MADPTAITKGVITRNAATAAPTFGTVVANTGALVTFDKADQNILLKLKNNITNATHTAVIVKGNGLQGVADLEIPIAASSEVCIVVESGKFMNVSGTNKGKVLILDKTTSGTAIEVAAIVLP